MRAGRGAGGDILGKQDAHLLGGRGRAALCDRQLLKPSLPPAECGLGNGTSDLPGLRGRTVVGAGSAGEGFSVGEVGEVGVWGEVAAGWVSRQMLVARLLELDAVGALTPAHVRAGAQVGGLTAGTV